jgi:amino acid adenylation domain-containing protein
LSLLSEAERQQIAAWNDTAAPFPTDRCFPDRFAEQAARTPDATALVYAGTTLSYRELNARANQLAHYLRRLGVGPESIIGLCLEPSLDMVIAVLGVLKAGGAFLPLDPAYPAERLAFMLEDSQPIVLLTLERLHPSAGLRTGVSRLAGSQVSTCQPANLQTCNLDTDWHLIAQEPESDPECSATPENLAYVIYTSGSTGRPKGTLLQYRGLSNFANVVIETFGITAASRVLQFASFSFDAAISELVVLLAGATLVLDRRETLTSPPDLIELLREQAISVVTLPPSLLALLPPDDLPDLQTVVSAGESCPWEVAERWRHGRRFLNGYGPTEATVGVAYYRVTGRVPGTISVPIGTPVANAQIYLLDRQGRLAPVGVPGELHIGGVGLARGYLNRPELTAERFITLPDVPTLQRSNVSTFQRLYKTGDLARYLPDGTIEFLGRIDQQVKIRGFRVELGEIEATVGSHPAVQTAAVVAQTDAAGLQRLVAYVVPRAEARIVGEGVDLNAGAPSVDLARVMRSFLQERLPDYMLPAAFVPLDALPLTPSGKVDRKALAARESGHFELEPDYVAPRTPEEEILAGIWASVFGAPQVGVNANFFELGGHSLLATQVVARLRDLMQVDVPLRSLFERPTLAEFAQAVAAARRMAQGMPAPPLRPAPRDGALPLSFAQQRLWFLDQLEPGGAFYNIPVAVRLSGVLDAAALERALNEVVRRHDILRTSIVTVAGQPQQVIAPADAAESRLTLMLIDRRDLPVADRDAEVLRLAAAEAQRPFDLARGPLLRTSLIRLDETEYAGLFVMHHIISDGWSMGVFVRELVACYVAGVNDQPASLPALPIQYADFAVWQRDWLGGKNVQPDATAHAETEERPGSPLQRQLDYWKQQLAGAPPLLELPTDRPRPALQSFRGASLMFELPKEQTGP